MCNGPKVEEVEERTGLGGGFNERDNVEYKSYNEDEVMWSYVPLSPRFQWVSLDKFFNFQDEYDEFGRKKKKKNKGPGVARGSRDSGSNGWEETKKQEEEEEEEEEDDDDGDLGKYDLWGEGDDAGYVCQ